MNESNESNMSRLSSMPICQSYTDMNESLRAQHRHSRIKHWILHWFFRNFIQLPKQSQSTIPIESSIDASTSSSSASPDLSTNVNSNNDDEKMLWSLNYLEASIYLEEGLNNDKFDNHPHLFTKLPMYLIAHNKFIYFIDLFCCLLILSLAVVEKPTLNSYHYPELIHASIELITLFIIGLILYLKYQWFGWKNILKHNRTIIKTLVLLLMIIEAFIVLLRQDTHFRVLRSLRPLFLIDNYYFYGCRRVIRQTIQSLRSFLNMLILLSFSLIFFTIIAYYLFSPIPEYEQFSSIINSFLSLFILLTTANFPDVMMRAYNQNQLYSIFFIIFLIINLYFLLNIMLAVVYNSFSYIEKQKFRKLFLHRRKACSHAFRLLISNDSVIKNGDEDDKDSDIVGYIKFEHFDGLLQYLKPKSNLLERYLMYKALIMKLFTPQEQLKTKHLLYKNDKNEHKSSNNDKNNRQNNKHHNDNTNNYLTLEKFYHIYEVLDLRWENLDRNSPWFDRSKNFNNHSNSFKYFFINFMYKLRRFVTGKYFNIFTYVIIILATLCEFFNGFINFDQQLIKISATSYTITIIIIIIFTIEILLKLLAHGFNEYFYDCWNYFDFFITILCLLLLILNELSFVKSNNNGWIHFNISTIITILITIRSLKLIELLRQYFYCYRDILGPISLIIIKRFTSVIMVIMIIYYFFAIISMECFGHYDLTDCCQNTTIEQYYRSIDNNSSSTAALSFYYLNNFQDLLSSYITLFELMIVNNWQITMSAYVIVTDNRWSHLFFISFYIITLVVITIVVSFVLDTFNFHIEYKHRFGPDDSMSVKISIEVPINQREFEYYQTTNQMDYHHHPSPKHFPCPFNIFWCCECLTSSSCCNNVSNFNAQNESFNKHMDQSSKIIDTTPSTPPPINSINDNVKDFEEIIEEESTYSRPVVVASSSSSSSRPSISVVVNKRTIMFRGEKIRDKFSYNLRMYHDELQKWINQSEFS